MDGPPLSRRAAEEPGRSTAERTIRQPAVRGGDVSEKKDTDAGAKRNTGKETREKRRGGNGAGDCRSPRK